MKPAIFLDRDGNVFLDNGVINNALDVPFLQYTFNAFQLSQKDSLLSKFTNLSGISKELISEIDVLDDASKYIISTI